MQTHFGVLAGRFRGNRQLADALAKLQPSMHVKQAVVDEPPEVSKIFQRLPSPRRSRATCRRLLMRPPPAPCCAACRPCCRAARLPAAAAALHPHPTTTPPPIAIIAADIQNF
jgi:hypothetical protein